MEERLSRGEVVLGARDTTWLRGGSARVAEGRVAAMIDGADTGRAGTIESYVTGAHMAASTDTANGLPVTNRPPIVQLSPRFS